MVPEISKDATSLYPRLEDKVRSSLLGDVIVGNVANGNEAPLTGSRVRMVQSRVDDAPTELTYRYKLASLKFPTSRRELTVLAEYVPKGSRVVP